MGPWASNLVRTILSASSALRSISLEHAHEILHSSTEHVTYVHDTKSIEHLSDALVHQSQVEPNEPKSASHTREIKQSMRTCIYRHRSGRIQ